MLYWSIIINSLIFKFMKSLISYNPFEKPETFFESFFDGFDFLPSIKQVPLNA